MRFEVILGDQIIGHSELEAGDPPMGVAGGRFLPTAAYSAIQLHCIEHRDNWKEIKGLSVRITGGATLECSGPIEIVDFSPELGETEMQIEVCGIPSPLYSELFPQHVEAYKNLFKKK